jgi:fructose-specific phosphotransferase system IIC component
MMLIGMIAAFTWNINGLSGGIYEVLPGMLGGYLVYVMARFLGFKRSQNLLKYNRLIFDSFR